jgi:uncharacterized protein (TIGR03435 family)
VTFACGSLVNFIQRAYILFANGRSNPPWFPPKIEGGPAWKDSDRYRINAKAEGNASPEMMQGPMFQALLEDRFKLKIHRETRAASVYALTVAKGGFKLRRVDAGSCTPMDYSQPAAPRQPDEKPVCGVGGFGRRGSLAFADIPAVSLDEFAKRLGGRLDRPVIDRTGITGLFDFHLEFAPDEATPGLRGPLPDGGDPNRPSDQTGGQSIFTALQQQLGLKLEAAKGPVEFLVIDHVERPTEN